MSHNLTFFPTTICRVQRMSAAPAGDGSDFGDAARGSSGDASNDASKPISTQLKAAANIEFGKVQTQAVGDAADLRKKLAGGA